MLHKLAQIREDYEDGFTLIELLVTILIIGILSAIAVPTFMNQRKKANDTAVLSDVRNAVTAVETYAIGVKDDLTPIPMAELDLRNSEGSRVEVKGNIRSYCVQGYHDNGDTYTIDHMLVSKSDSGIDKTAKACPDSGYLPGGEMDITPGAPGQAVEFTDNGAKFGVTLSAISDGARGMHLMGSYTETKNKSFQATLADVKCKDESIKGLLAPRNFSINFSGNKFAQPLLASLFAPGCEPTEVTISPRGASTVDQPTTIPVAYLAEWSGEKSGESAVKVSVPTDTAGGRTSVDSKIQMTAKNGQLSWKIDPVSMPSFVDKLDLTMTVWCEDGRYSSYLSGALSGEGSQSIGSCNPSRVVIGGSAIGSTSAHVENVTISLK